MNVVASRFLSHSNCVKPRTTFSQHPTLFKHTLKIKGLQTSRQYCTNTTPEDFKNTEIYKRIDELVKKDKLVLFMKGNPDVPQCGFSRIVVQIFYALGVKNYSTYDVLADNDLREGVKKYANWPTIPQVFVNGEFIGGSDITLSLFRSGELQKMFDEAGIQMVTETA